MAGILSQKTSYIHRDFIAAGISSVEQRGTRGPFLESPVNFSGPKSNIQIEIKRIRARVLASKLLHFVSLTDSFIMLDAILLKLRSLMETETTYRAR